MEAKTAAADAYVCGMGMMFAVLFSAMAMPLAIDSLIAFWILVLLGEVCGGVGM